MATYSSRPTIELDAATVDLLDQRQLPAALRRTARSSTRRWKSFTGAVRERAYGSRIVSIDPADGTVRALNLAVLDAFVEKAKRRQVRRCRVRPGRPARSNEALPQTVEHVVRCSEREARSEAEPR